MFHLNTMWKISPLNENVNKIHNTITFCQTTTFLKWFPGLQTLKMDWSSLVYWNHFFFLNIYRPDIKLFLLLFNSLGNWRQNKFIQENITVFFLSKDIVFKRNRKILIYLKIPKIKPPSSHAFLNFIFTANMNSSEYMCMEHF